MGKWFDKEYKIEAVRLVSGPANTQSKIERDLWHQPEETRVAQGRRPGVSGYEMACIYRLSYSFTL